MDSGFGTACRPGMTDRETTMQALRFFFSPGGRLKPQPFIYGAIAVYLFGAASHLADDG